MCWLVHARLRFAELDTAASARNGTELNGRQRMVASMDYEQIAAELIRSLRGKRSQAAFSRKLGYKSNIVNRWEAREAFPSASTFLAVVASVHRKQPSPLLRFFPRPPEELAALGTDSARSVAMFLREHCYSRDDLASVEPMVGLAMYKNMLKWGQP